MQVFTQDGNVATGPETSYLASDVGSSGRHCRADRRSAVHTARVSGGPSSL